MFKDLSEYLITAALAIAALVIVYGLFAQWLTAAITGTFGQLAQ